MSSQNKDHFDILESLSIEELQSTETISPLSLEEVESEEIETIEHQEPCVNTIQEEQVKETKTNSILSSILFIIKYIFTTGCIFWVLLVTTNYSAYSNLVKSYIFKEQLTQKSELLVHSVAASSIQEKAQEEKEIDRAGKKGSYSH